MFYCLRGIKSTQKKGEIRGIEEQGILSDRLLDAFLFSVTFYLIHRILIKFAQKLPESLSVGHILIFSK